MKILKKFQYLFFDVNKSKMIVNFLYQNSILEAPVIPDPVIFFDLA